MLNLSGCSSSVQRESHPPDTAIDSAGVSVNSGADVRRAETAGENNPFLDRHRFLALIMGLMGTPYAQSGADTSGFDCSGFTAKVYLDAAARILPRSCSEQYLNLAPLEGEGLKFGDLLFFDTKGEGVSHVGIYLGDGLFAHASLSSGVVVSILGSDYYKRHYVGARRVFR